MSAESAYNTSKAASGELVDSLFGGSSLNYLDHRACIRKESLAARCSKMHVELGDLARQKELAGGQERNHPHRSTRNGAWLSAVPYRLNGTELSWQEFWDNLRLKYGLMHQDIPATCDGCGKKLSIEHAISCQKCGLVLEQHDDTENEWGPFVAQTLIPSAITYEPKINSRTVQEKKTTARAQQEGGEANSSMETVEEPQGGRGRTVNRAARLVEQSGQVVVPAESRASLSDHGFWKRGTTVMFDIIIINIDVGSYLNMTPEKDIAMAEQEKKELYLQAFLERTRTFTPIVYSADVIPRAEALAVHKRLATLLRYKLNR